jgi:hypothetical protein
MQKRNRDGEGGVPFEYICKNIERHDRWLLSLPSESVLVINVDEDFENNPDLFKQHVAKIRTFLGKD